MVQSMPSLKEIFDSFKVKHETLFSKGTILQVVYNDKMSMLKLGGATHSVINKKSIYTPRILGLLHTPGLRVQEPEDTDDRAGNRHDSLAPFPFRQWPQSRHSGV